MRRRISLCVIGSVIEYVNCMFVSHLLGIRTKFWYVEYMVFVETLNNNIMINTID